MENSKANVLVSALITTHNRKNLLPRAIESVLKQTYKNIELIVVSDGSTDGTDELMKQYSDESRVKYINYFPGRGGNYARNIGIKAANGEYIAFLDDDDEWLPEKIEEQVRVMESDPTIGLVYSGTKVIYVDEKLQYISIPNKEGDLSREILNSNSIGSTTTVMVKKSIFQKTGLFDENLLALQDYDMWIRICQYAKVGLVALPLVNYYNYKNSSQVSSNTKKYENAYNYIWQKYSELFSIFNSHEEKIWKANKQIALGKRAMRNGSPKEARKYYIKSMNYCFRVKTLGYLILTIFKYSSLLKLRSMKN